MPASWAASINVSVITSKGTPIPGIKVYAFKESGTYTGVYTTADTDGLAVFDSDSFAAGNYKFKAVYLGCYFWSGVVTLPETLSVALTIETETAEVAVTTAAGAASSIKVYLYSDTGSCLSLYETTDGDGLVSFELPVGKSFKFKAYILYNNYWSDVLTILSGSTNYSAINAGGGILQITVDKGEGLPLAGIKTYLFSASGSYLGFYQITDDSGMAQFNVPEGSFKIKADYLGSKFWTGETSVTGDTDIELTIPHKDVVITVQGSYQEASSPIQGIKTYLYSSSGTCLSKYGATDADGHVIFNLPQISFKVRADYLGQKFWSDEFTWEDTTISIPYGMANVHVTKNYSNVQGVKVYLYSDTGSCLGRYDVADSAGIAEFIIPSGSYEFKASLAGVIKYSDIISLAADQTTVANIDFSDLPTISFSASPDSIQAGGASVLTWSVINADMVSIDNIGGVDINGSIAVTPSATTVYTLTAAGPGGTSTSSATVTYINSAPVAYDKSISSNEDEQVLIILGAMDADNDPLIYSLVSSPSHGILSGDANNFTYLPDADYYGTDLFTFMVNDGTVDSAAATIGINVLPVNDTPVANAGNDQTAFSGDTVSLDGSLSSDLDGDPLSFKWAFSSMPSGSNASLSDSTSTRPFFIADKPGTYEVILIVNDGYMDSLSDTVFIAVNSSTVEVPNVVGMSQVEAKSAIVAAGLVTGMVSTAYDEEIPEDQVISQYPASGVIVEKGSYVGLVVSIGPNPLSGNGEIYGTTIDALTGSVLSGAEITLSIEQDDETYTVVSHYGTSEDGTYIFSDLHAGNYLIKTVLEGYITEDNSIALDSDDSSVNQNVILSPAMNSGEVRIVLTWGETPEDLESHLTAPNNEGCRYHCFYDTREIPGADLDLDDRTSYGPETITITSLASGTYRYYVHDFTNRNSKTSTALSLSGAHVRVYFGSGAAPLDFNVPSGEGTVWHVFDIDGETQQITTFNTMTFQDQPGEIDFPVITTSPGASANLGEAYTYQVSAEDPDDDILVYSLEESPDGMTIDPLTGVIAWTPAEDQGGYHDVTVNVSDNRCGEDTQTFKIYVTYMPIVNFSSEPLSAFNENGDITLTWSTERAETVRIDKGIGLVSSNGSITISSSDEPVFYILTAENGSGKKTAIVPNKPSGSFTASKYELPATGGTVTLTWSFPNAVTCNINQGVGDVSTSGSVEVIATDAPITFIMTASNGAGITTSSITIKEACSDSIEIEATTVPACTWSAGDPVTLSWKTTAGCVDTCEIDQGIGEVASSGSILVTPDETKSYTITCTGSSGTSKKRIILPQILSSGITTFYANSSYISPGSSVKLTWTTQCVDKCTIDQGIGEVGANGSIIITPSSLPITYTMTVEGGGETKTKAVTINPRITATFEAAPSILKVGESATLTWTTVNADYCEITPDIGEVELNGSVTVQPSGAATYMLYASSSTGSVRKYATVTYIAPTAQLLAYKEIIDAGEGVALSWVFSNAETCTIDQGIGEVENGESITVTPDKTTTYAMIAAGPGGTATDSVTITVVYPPDIDLVQPDGVYDTANQYYAIKWTDEDADNNAAISLYYDTDNSGNDGTLIASDIYEDTDPTNEDYDKYIWDTSDMAEGAYYIYAVIDDGYYTPVTDYSDGMVTIDHSLSAFKLKASDGQEYDHFGSAVALDQGYAIIGTGNYGGQAAYIFKQEGESWVEQAKLMSDDAEDWDYGYSVSISGEYAVVRAYGGDDLGYRFVAAYIFKRTGDVWDLQDKITLSNENDNDYRGSISINGDLLIIGTPSDDENGLLWDCSYGGECLETYPGAAYIYKRYGSNWVLQKKLLGNNSGQTHSFGGSVNINGNKAIVGAIGLNDNDGRAYVFEYNGADWVEQQELSVADGGSSSAFGHTVSIDKDNAIVGDPQHYNTLNSLSYAGAAYIFSSTDSIWSEQAMLESADIEENDFFGSSVSIDGNHAIVGVPRDDEAYLFEGVYDDDGVITSWTTKMKLLAPDYALGDSFGSSVLIKDGYAIIGAPYDDDNGSGSGSAYIYPIYLAVRGSADPEIIEKGGLTTLSWTSVLADSCVIEPGIGTVSPNGTIVVSPLETTTYVITATGTDGSVSEGVTVKVVDPSILPTAEISASPETIDYADSITITWNADNAMSCTIEPYIGTVPNSGSIIVIPTEDTTYTITAVNTGGSTTASVTVKVICYYPEVSITVDHETIDLGSSATITWTGSKYAYSCNIQPDIGDIDASGSVTVSPEDSTTYILTATGPCGTASYNIPITIIGAAVMKITYPDGVNDYANQNIEIKWTDAAPDIDAAISLYYDTDNTGEDGTLIVSGINETPDGDTADTYSGWDTSQLPEGEYYIYGIIDDGTNTPGVDYSDGPIKIVHSTVQESLKISLNDVLDGTQFGYSVAVDGDYAIIGDSNDSAYIYKKDGSIWTRQTRLIIEDINGAVDSEKSVSLDGDYAIVGAPEATNESNVQTGMVYIFVRQGDTWVQQARFAPNDGYSGIDFGCSASISGDYAAIGTLDYSAYIFKREGNTWAQHAKLTTDAWNNAGGFGNAVSISGDYVIVGAKDADETWYRYDWGAAYVYKRDGDTWTQQSRLVAKDGYKYNHFGTSVAIDGDYAYVGTPYHEVSGYSSAGAVYVFKRSDAYWSQMTELNDPSPSTSGYFGQAVAINNNRVIIGAHYKAYIYEYDGTEWNQKVEYVPYTTSYTFGASVAITENYALVGDYGDDDAGSDAGVVYFYPLASVDISAAPETILSGASTTLTWSSTNAESCTIEPDIGTVDPSGSITVSPSDTTTYTITATGSGITATDKVTVTVTYPVPVAIISAVPATINVNENSTLTWSATNATSCVIDNGVGNVDVTGSTTVTPTTNTTYTITATGPGGTSTASITVTVVYPVPTVTLTATPQIINTGSSSVLTWSTENATSCVIDPDIGAVDVNGTVTVSPTATTTYTITATGQGGSTSKEVIVTVNPSNVIINSPLSGSTVYSSSILVEGTVLDQTGEFGVTVNGVVALVDGDYFVANDVPLEEGENTLTITVTDADGNTTIYTMTVYYQSSDTYISVTVNEETGVAPFETTLKVGGTFTFDTEPEISYTGPADIEITDTDNDNEYQITITTPGLYFITADVEYGGVNYSDTIAVMVMDQEVLDALLKAKWNGMKTALSEGNISDALEYIAEDAKDLYEYNFNILSDHLSEFSIILKDIVWESSTDGKVDFSIDTEYAGESYNLLVRFIRDNDGIWRIRFF